MLRRSPVVAPIAVLAAVAVLAPAPARAQGKLLTLDDLFDPDKRIDFGGTPPTGLVWASDTHYLWPKSDPKTRQTEWLKVEALTGKSAPFFDAARMETALARLPGVSADEAKRLARQRSYTWNETRTAALLTIGGDLYHYPLGSDTAVRLTVSPAAEEEATYSPDGAFVAFVRENDLYLVDVAGQRERRVTTDGSPDVLNGKLDWVYQEEIYGRGHYRAYWWSPDSARLAFLRLDERDVPKYTLVDDMSYRPIVESWHYPKAGDPNPRVRLGLARVAGGPPSWIDLDKYTPIEFLVVDVSWTPDGSKVVYQVQDREQTWLDLNVAGAAGGEPKALFRETSPAWVEREGSPRWLKDGSFLWLSERSGWKHVYHYQADGTLIRQVTEGKWEARNLRCVDEAGGVIYLSATERSPIAADVYRVNLQGGGLARLSSAPGAHNPNFNPSCTHYLDSWNDATTPTQVRLHRADGTEVRAVELNKVAPLAEYRLAKPEFLQVKTRDGFVMEAMMLKPPDFDPARKYPVFQHTYGGPHAPQVRNAWGGASMFHQLLAQRGIVVWVCDNRTASGKGAESVWPGYQRMGELELQDIEDCLSWLKQQPYIDGSRIGINGWSYGGFMVSYALTHSKSFAMGIAGGSVTDWRNYDSIYTERYMKMPQNNPDGYRRTAPRLAAKDLHGKLLLIHGAIDDNVHPQNTLQLAHELQKAGKPFRMMLYPKSRHGVGEPRLQKHMYEMMLDFITETLIGGQGNAVVH
jgi:dipeptidyl-peptidase-4